MLGWTIFAGNVDELQGKHPFGDGDCVDLVQAVTDVGHTSRWQRGPRVLDLLYLNPGTVVANFLLINGAWRFPNKHGYHVGLFVEFGPGNLPVEKPAGIWLMDQFKKRDPMVIGERRIIPRGNLTHAQGNTFHDCDNAEHYYVVELL